MYVCIGEHLKRSTSAGNFMIRRRLHFGILHFQKVLEAGDSKDVSWFSVLYAVLSDAEAFRHRNRATPHLTFGRWGK
jgi:hypothetical protein